MLANRLIGSGHCLFMEHLALWCIEAIMQWVGWLENKQLTLVIIYHGYTKQMNLFNQLTLVVCDLLWWRSLLLLLLFLSLFLGWLSESLVLRFATKSRSLLMVWLAAAAWWNKPINIHSNGGSVTVKSVIFKFWHVGLWNPWDWSIYTNNTKSKYLL